MSFFRTFRSPDRFSANDSGEILVEKFDYDVNGLLIYQGATNKIHPSDDEEVWALCKFTYDTNDLLIRTEYRYASAWTTRALNDWEP